LVAKKDRCLETVWGFVLMVFLNYVILYYSGRIIDATVEKSFAPFGKLAGLIPALTGTGTMIDKSKTTHNVGGSL